MTLEELFGKPAIDWEKMTMADIEALYKDLINITRPSPELRAKNSAGTKISKQQQEAEVLRNMTPEQRARFESARNMAQQYGFDFDMDDILKTVMK